MNNIILKQRQDSPKEIETLDVVMEFILVPENQCGDLQPVELNIHSITGVENDLLTYRTFDFGRYCEYIHKLNDTGVYFSNAYRNTGPTLLVEDFTAAVKPNMFDYKTLFSLSKFVLRPTNISIAGKRLFYITARLMYASNITPDNYISKHTREGALFVKHVRECEEINNTGVWYNRKFIGFTMDNAPDVCFKPFLNILKGYMSIRDMTKGTWAGPIKQ